MNKPFCELHEIYRIIFLKSEAQAKADEERKKKEEADKKAKEKDNRPKGIQPPAYYKPNKKLTDVNMPQTSQLEAPSPLEAEALEDMLEDLAEGGVM